MNRKVFLFIISLSLSPSPGTAQQYVDILNIGYSQNAESDYQDSNNRLSHKGLWAYLKAPIQLNEKKDYLISSVNYSSAYLKNDFYSGDPLSLHDLGVDVAYLKNWNKPAWTSYMSVGLAAASDFSSLKNGALNYNTTFLLLYKKREGLSWSLGFNFKVEAFGNVFIPLVGVNWEVSPKLNLSFLSFSHLKLEYQFSDRLGGGLKMQNGAFSFALPDFPGLENGVIHSYADRFPFTPQKAFAYIDWYFTEQMVVFGRSGFEFAKEIIHEGIDEADRNSYYNGEVDAGVFFETGLAWRIRLKK